MNRMDRANALKFLDLADWPATDEPAVPATVGIRSFTDEEGSNYNSFRPARRHP
jgi:hypothetical protein